MNVEKELFGAYAFYAGVVTVKMMAMAFLTARQRISTSTFANSEDATDAGAKVCITEWFPCIDNDINL